MRPIHALATLLIAAAFAGCGGDGDDDGGNGGGATTPPVATQPETTGTTGTTTEREPAVDGAEVFASSGCGSCHQLAAANAKGVTGPNLDDVQPGVDEVREQVINGGGGMPAFGGDLSDEEIDAVSTYVAENAGQ